MKSKTLKKCSLAFALLFSCSIVVQSLVPFQHSTNTVDTTTRSIATATATTNIATYYFYNQLSNSKMAQKFYNALVAMEKGDILKSGTGEYDLIKNGILTEAEVNNYMNNADSTILVAFSAARDAFILDNPSLFYVNADNLGVTIGTKDGKAYATLGTGRDDSYCITKEWKKEDVENAVKEYQAKVKKIAENAKAAGENPTDMISYVNDWLCNRENMTYSFCEEYKNGKDEYPYGEAACDLRGTAYGSLVNGKGVCESFARGFKAIMDELNIPCVLVYGICTNEPHMWNYVQLDGRWYAIDTTWNNTSEKSLKYYLKGSVDFENDHAPSGILSDFEFGYPELSKYQYGVSADEGGFNFTPEYKDEAGNVKRLELTFSYDGKSVSKLYEEGIYVAYRQIVRNTTVQDIIMTPWVSAYEAHRVYGNNIWSEDEDTKDTKTIFYFYPGTQSVQFMLVTKAPDDTDGAIDPDTGEPYYFYYSEDEFEATDIIKVSETHSNDAYGTYFPAPGVIKSTPGNSTSLNATGEFIDCELTFSQDLVPVDEWTDKNDPSLVSASSIENIISSSASAINTSENDKIDKIRVDVSGLHSDIEKYIEIKDVVWDAANPRVVSFKFKASQQFKHAYETYTFYVRGLVGDVSGKEPDSYNLYFSKRYVICPKVFNDGRDYIVCYGQPQIAANEDLSISGWTADDGTVFSASQRSQMMLVVNDVNSSSEKETMLNSALEQEGASGNSISSSATYEINLQICNLYTKIPKGSHLQVSIGFPDGMTYDDFKDGNKTLKMYHYKRGDDGEIDPSLTEEINISVTPYGLVAKVTDFSPFAVVVYDSKEVAPSKHISASVLGKGGTILGTEVTKFENGENSQKTITYTLVPNEGYQVDKVLVNDKEINITDEAMERSQVAGVKVGIDEAKHTTLTFSKDELESINTLVQVSFVANRVVEYEETENITPVQKTLVLENTGGVIEINPIVPETPDVPVVPDIPNKPEEPDTPDEPNKPEEPDNPDEPNKPEEPDNPDEPSKPEEPDKPDEPNKPDNPDNPTTPVVPNIPSTGNGGTISGGSSGSSGSPSISGGGSSSNNTQITTPTETTPEPKPDETIDTPPTVDVVPTEPIETPGDTIELVPSQVFNNTKKPNLNTKIKKGSKKVSFEWSEIDGADGYKIYQYNSNTDKYKCIKTITDPTTTAFSKKMQYGSSYSFKVRAFTIGDDGSKTYGKYSTAIEVTTSPNIVKGLTIKLEDSKATLSWKKVKNADGYQIFRSKKKNGTYSRIKTVKNGSLNATVKQADNQTYYYKVRAFVRDVDDNRVCGEYGKVVSTKS